MKMFKVTHHRWQSGGNKQAVAVVSSHQQDDDTVLLQVHYTDHAVLRVKLQRKEDSPFQTGLDGTFSNVLPNDYAPGITLPAKWSRVRVTCLNVRGQDTVIAFHRSLISGKELYADFLEGRNRARYLVIQRPAVAERRSEVPHHQSQPLKGWDDFRNAVCASS